MIKSTKNGCKATYFAAANGYSGFRSYFGELFKSEKYNSVYVLKGGPGTGKSTLFKRVIAYSHGIGLSTEAILCSSDPSSLDGAIITGARGKIALLDGTAPHERDAAIPGAIDEIINLADGFNKDLLRGQKDEILRLSGIKRQAYKTAYEMLSAAGKVHLTMHSIFEKFGYNKEAELIFDKFSAGCREALTSYDAPRLISAFCKLGHFIPDAAFDSQSRIIPIRGNGVSEYLFMDALKRYLVEHGIQFESFPSPLSEELTDGISAHGIAVFVSAVPSSFDTAPHCAQVDSEGMKIAKIYSSLLDSSRAYFEKASDAHFALEAIYSPATDFENNEIIITRLCAEIDRYLGN